MPAFASRPYVQTHPLPLLLLLLPFLALFLTLAAGADAAAAAQPPNIIVLLSDDTGEAAALSETPRSTSESRGAGGYTVLTGAVHL